MTPQRRVLLLIYTEYAEHLPTHVLLQIKKALWPDGQRPDRSRGQVDSPMTVQRQRLQQLLDEVLNLSVAETKPPRRSLSSVASVSALPVTASQSQAVTAPGACAPCAPGAPSSQEQS